MPLLIARHGERIDFVDDKWIDSAERPFDPPLTSTGVAQGSALGARLRAFSPPITKVFVSPLVRTVQTADAAAAELGLTELFVEPGLTEVLDAGWYRCWRCTPSDPRGNQPAGSLLLTPDQLREEVTKRVDTSYKPVMEVSALEMTRSNTESWPALRARLDKVCRALAAAHPEESILLVTHGGPIEVACPALDPRVDPRAKVRYTCLSVFQPDAAAPAGFTCVLHADASHAGL